MIDWTKPVRTKGTKTKVRILSLDGPGSQPVVGYLLNDDPEVFTWNLGGGLNPEPVSCGMDLENTPPAPSYSIKCTAGEIPGRAWCWLIQCDYGHPIKRNIAVCETRDDAETIAHLLNGSK